MTRLDRHNAIVTGAGSGIGIGIGIGIGKAIAQRLAAEGAKILVNDLRASTAGVAVGLVTENDGTAIAQEGDVSDPAHIDTVFGACDQTCSGCTLLVNAAFLASDDARLYVGQTLGPNSGDVML